MNRRNKSVSVILITAILALGASSALYVRSKFRGFDTIRQDIYYLYVEGKRIISGENPYTRVLEGDMRSNDKYATYLPLFYLLSSASQLAGYRTPRGFVKFWRYVFTFCSIGVGFLIFYILYRGKHPILGLFGALFWFFNRWTLNVAVIAHIEFLPILLLLVSLLMLKDKPGLSLFILGISLAIKHIAVFAVPLYLINIWHRHKGNTLREMLIGIFLVMSVPVAVSLPFIIWNARGFVYSILFSATRDACGHFGVYSIDHVFGIGGITAKIPMLALIVLVYCAFGRREIGIYMAVLFVLSAFLFLNSVLFVQYMCWIVPFIPLAAYNMIDTNYARNMEETQ